MILHRWKVIAMYVLFVICREPRRRPSSYCCCCILCTGLLQEMMTQFDPFVALVHVNAIDLVALVEVDSEIVEKALLDHLS